MTDDKQAWVPGLRWTLLPSERHEVSFLGHPRWAGQVLQEIWEARQGKGRAKPGGWRKLEPTQEKSQCVPSSSVGGNIDVLFPGQGHGRHPQQQKIRTDSASGVR